MLPTTGPRAGRTLSAANAVARRVAMVATSTRYALPASPPAPKSACRAAAVSGRPPGPARARSPERRQPCGAFARGAQSAGGLTPPLSTLRLPMR